MNPQNDAAEATAEATVEARPWVPQVTVDARRCPPVQGEPDAYFVAVVAKTMEDAGSMEAKQAALQYANNKWGGTVSLGGQQGPHADDGRRMPDGFAAAGGPVESSAGFVGADAWRQMAARQNMAAASGRQTGYVTFFVIRRPEAMIQ